MKAVSLFLSVLLPAICGSQSFARTAGKPDIVIFLTDDQSQLDLTPYGDRTLRTPHMQELAKAGMIFTDAYVASPTCAPSRAALLTGLMPARNGAEPNHAKPSPEIRKWPSYLQELGYEVVAFGKVSHYKHTADYGFDYFAHDTFHDHAGIAAATEFLKNRSRNGAKPLCLFVGSNWPHVPWPESGNDYDPAQLPLPAGSVDTPATRAWRARYAAAVTKADDDLGVIMDAARSYLGTNTLFLFSSDNGAQWPFAKWNCYEAGVRTPLIVAWPGVVKPDTRTSAMVSWVDFLPTLLEAAGGKPPGQIDGRSFLPVLRGKRSSHRDAIFTTHSGDGRFNIYPIRAVRSGQWKYIRNLHPSTRSPLISTCRSISANANISKPGKPSLNPILKQLRSSGVTTHVRRRNSTTLPPTPTSSTTSLLILITPRGSRKCEFNWISGCGTRAIGSRFMPHPACSRTRRATGPGRRTALPEFFWWFRQVRLLFPPKLCKRSREWRSTTPSS